MAETEILDLTSRRWQRTRAALARSGDDAAIRRRLDWHLSTTRISSEQHALIAEHQYRHAQEVIATLGRLSADRLDNVSYPIQ